MLEGKREKKVLCIEDCIVYDIMADYRGVYRLSPFAGEKTHKIYLDEKTKRDSKPSKLPSLPTFSSDIMSSRLAQLDHKLCKISLGRILDVVVELLVIFFDIRALDTRKVVAIPVHAHQPADEQVVADVVVAVVARDVGHRVVQQECVADGPVDGAVEDVGCDFALGVNIH